MRQQCLQDTLENDGNLSNMLKIMKIEQLSSGDYDYCRMMGTWQLSPLEVGEDNLTFEPKKFRKIQIHQYGQTMGCDRGLLSPTLASILC